MTFSRFSIRQDWLRISKFTTFLSFILYISIYGATSYAQDIGFTEIRAKLVASQGDIPLRLQLAHTDKQRQHGLMFRESLAPYDGMLFDFEMEQPIAMWMKNTPLPLDMLFFGEDKVIHTIIENTKPYSLDTLQSPYLTRYVLEVPAGFIAHHCLGVGDHLAIEPK